MNAETKQPEEGDACPYADCEGKLHYPPVEGCYCHISPPCHNCVEQLLVCPDCGWTEGEEVECEHEWEVRDDSFDHEFGTEKIPPYEVCLKCDAHREHEAPIEEYEHDEDLA